MKRVQLFCTKITCHISATGTGVTTKKTLSHEFLVSLTYITTKITNINNTGSATKFTSRLFN